MGGAHRKYNESVSATALAVVVVLDVILLALSPIWPLALWVAAGLSVSIVGAVSVTLAVRAMLSQRGSHGK